MLATFSWRLRCELCLRLPLAPVGSCGREQPRYSRRGLCLDSAHNGGGGLYVEADMSRFSGHGQKLRPGEGAAVGRVNTYISALNIPKPQWRTKPSSSSKVSAYTCVCTSANAGACDRFCVSVSFCGHGNATAVCWLCVRVCVLVCVCKCVCVSVSSRMCVYTCLPVFVRLCFHLRVFVCVCISVFACMCVCRSVCLRVSAQVCVNIPV